MKYKKIGILISLIVLSVFAVKMDAAAPTSGLVGYWNFDEGSGTVANDTSGSGNNGAINGASWVAGKACPVASSCSATGVGGGGLSFDGSSNYINILDNASLDALTTNFTLTAWIKTNKIGYQSIYDSGTQTNRWKVGLDIGNRMVFTKIGIADYDTDPNILNTNTWYFVTFVKNGDSGTNLTFYRNGSVIDTASVGTVATPSGTKQIGRDGTTSYMGGLLDEVRVYNRALSVQEILDVYNDTGTPLILSAPTIPSFSASPSLITQGQFSTLSWSVSGNPTPTIFIDNGVGTVAGTSVNVSPTQTTTYTLTAQNSQGSATANTSVTVTTPPSPDTQTPTVPTNLSVTTIFSSQINLSWTASTDNIGVTGYKVYRNGLQIATIANTSYSDTGLSASTQYTYNVAAFDAAGNTSALSTVASATTQEVSPPSSDDIYISQNSSGLANGSSCANAYAVSFFNTAGNWGTGASQIGPGTTVHLCGIFTGSAGQTLLTFRGSGTSGNPITLKFENGALLTAPYWSSVGAISTNGNSWLTIDGGTNGTIQNTLNGTTGAACLAGPCSFQQASRLIYMGGGAATLNIVVKNLDLINVYVHTPNSGDTFSDNNTECVYIGLNHSNVTVDNILCHDSENGFDGWGNNITISNSELYNCNRCILFGTNLPTSGYVVRDNYIHDPQNWDEAVSNDYHHDNIHLFPNSGSANASGVMIYNNRFAGGGACCNTAHVYFEGTFTSPKIFNNLFDNNVLAPYNHMPSLRMGSGTGPQNITNPLIVNNTFLGGQINFSGNGNIFTGTQTTGVTIENNLITGGNGLVSIQPGGSVSVINNNVYEDIVTGGGSGCMFGFNGICYNSFSSWKAVLPAGSGQDSASLMNILPNLKIFSTGYLQSSSPALGAGINLTSLGITTLNSDKAGNLRPAIGPWDIGAYQFSSGGTPDTTPPAAPTNVIVN